MDRIGFCYCVIANDSEKILNVVDEKGDIVCRLSINLSVVDESIIQLNVKHINGINEADFTLVHVQYRLVDHQNDVYSSNLVSSFSNGLVSFDTENVLLGTGMMLFEVFFLLGTSFCSKLLMPSKSLSTKYVWIFLS